MDEIEKCDKEISDIEEEIKKLNERKKEKYIECNEKKYETAKELYDKKLLDLLKYIVKYKINNYNDLITRFPDSKERTKGLYTKNYIFEALWKIIFLFKFDNLVDIKQFKRNYKYSIEREIKGIANDTDEYKYLNGDNAISKINGGSVSGICDFFFTTTELDRPEETKKQWACEEPLFTPHTSDAYLFTSKFYGKPQGIANFDFDPILTEVRELYKDKDNVNFKIVSLVKHGAELKKTIERSDKSIAKYVDSGLIFDEGDMQIKYYPMLWEWLEHNFIKSATLIDDDSAWETLLNDKEKTRPILNISDNLKFHQKYIVEYTNDLIKKNENKTEQLQNSGRYIWGAVARSGKSYMVGGLVAKIKPKIVLLLLGAINETKQQFIDDLFKKYTDLCEEYSVIEFQDGKWKTQKKQQKWFLS